MQYRHDIILSFIVLAIALHIRVTFSTTASVIVTSDTMFLAHSFSFSLLLFVFLRFFVVSSSLSPDQIIEIWGRNGCSSTSGGLFSSPSLDLNSKIHRCHSMLTQSEPTAIGLVRVDAIAPKMNKSR